MKVVHFLLDETGSMAGMLHDAITGYNGFVDKLEAETIDVQLALTKFDSSKLEQVHPFVPLDEAIRLNEENYRPGANTPLYDAVVHVIRKTETMVRELEQHLSEKPDILIVVLTDGEENASQEHDADGMKAAIKEHEDAWGWSFMYLGASLDAWANEPAFAGTVMAASSLQSSGGQGLQASMAAASDVTLDWAVASQGARLSVSDDIKHQVKQASEDPT